MRMKERGGGLVVGGSIVEVTLNLGGLENVPTVSVPTELIYTHLPTYLAWQHFDKVNSFDRQKGFHFKWP